MPLPWNGIYRDQWKTDTPDVMAEKDRSVILIIENEDDTRRLYADALYPLNRPVVEAANSYEAFVQLGTHDIALVVTDIFMPGGGLEYLVQLRRRVPECPILAVSGSVTDQMRDEVIGAGADAFLRKPFTTARLRSAVQDLLAQPRRGAEAPEPVSDEQDHDWVFVCDECSQQWPLNARHTVRTHEQQHGHSVYQRYRAAYENRRNDDREECA